MTAVLQSPSHLASSPSSQLSCSSNDALQTLLTSERINQSLVGIEEEAEREREREISILALLVSVVRRSLAHCKAEGEGEDLHPSMEIGWPTEVRHVAHVTFDRFHGFLGLPVEFEPEVPRRAPSASATVFGVSTESMQCSYDSRGNSVPTILVLMQRRLYERGGLQAEGIFRINPGNSQEEYVRDQLNSGIVPDGIDVHCLAGLIKAWFRELPTGVLDPLTPEQVMQCQTEEECAQVVKLLPPMESALLDWAINLMADVVQEEEKNKMNARNVAMVFAPNMTQMADPLNALMYAVQVMNFLRMLILNTLKARKESTSEEPSRSHANPSDENGHQSPQLPLEACNDEAIKQVFVDEEPILDVHPQVAEDNNSTLDSSQTSYQDVIAEDTIREVIAADSSSMDHVNSQGAGKGKSCNTNLNKGSRNDRGPSPVKTTLQAEISKGAIIISHINSRVERIEAWR